MSYLLKSLRGKKKHANARIVEAGFEESTSPKMENEVTLASVTTTGSSSSCSSASTEDDLAKIKHSLKEEHSVLGHEACDRVLHGCTEDEGWQVWDTKGNLVVSKKVKDKGVVGRAQLTWTIPRKDDDTPLYTFDDLTDYLWDDKTKNEYDEFTERILLMLEHDEDFHVIDQIFKGRFGISGRDFVLVVRRRRQDTATHDRLIIGAQSVPATHLPQLEAVLEPETAELYKALSAKVVRGICHIGGYLLERSRATNECRLVYINDADVKSKGVPQWIVTRVKLDQLKIITTIPDRLAARINNH